MRPHAPWRCSLRPQENDKWNESERRMIGDGLLWDQGIESCPPMRGIIREGKSQSWRTVEAGLRMEGDSWNRANWRGACHISSGARTQGPLDELDTGLALKKPAQKTNGGSTAGPPMIWKNEKGKGGRMEDEVVPPGPQAERVLGKNEGYGRQISPVKWGQRTAEDPPRIGLPGGMASTYPPGQIRGMCGTTEEVNHRVVSDMAVGICRVVGPAYGVTVVHESWAVGIQSRAGRWRIYRTEAADLWLGPLVGGPGGGGGGLGGDSPETAQSVQSFGLVWGIWPRDMCLPLGCYQRWQ